jgi:carbonic anhydrase-like protein
MAETVIYESPTPYDQARIHAAAIYCSDGRVGEQIDEFLHHGLRLPRYDRLALPGGPACLSGSLVTFLEARAVEDALRFLIRVHDLEKLVLIAHDACAYYRERLGVPESSVIDVQRQDLEKGLRTVRKLQDGLEVQAFLAHTSGTRIRFEPLQ